MKITEELIQQRVDIYIDKNKERILADIDSRIEKAVGKSIKDYFASSNWRDTHTQQYIKGKIEKMAVTCAGEVEIDIEEIQKIVNKKVAQEVKKINVQVGG